MAKNVVKEMNVGDGSVIKPDVRFIKFEGTNDVWFWRVSGNSTNPDCEIIVPPTHSVLFIKNGKMQDILEGGSHKIHAVVKKRGLFRKPQLDAVDVDVIFLNRTIKFLVDWKNDVPILYRDPISEKVVHVSGCGKFEVVIDSPTQFYLQIIGTDRFYDIDGLQARINYRLMEHFDAALQKVIRENVYSYLDIQMHKKDIGDALLPILNELMTNEVGLKLTSFTVTDMGIPAEEQKMIEEAFEARREELRIKKDAKEIAEELERLADKRFALDKEQDERDWERALILKQLEQADKEKYYEVQKILVEKMNPIVNQAGPQVVVVNGGARACSKCGTPLAADSKFCSSCGTPVATKKFCSSCGKELDASAAFCPHCGTRA